MSKEIEELIREWENEAKWLRQPDDDPTDKSYGAALLECASQLTELKESKTLITLDEAFEFFQTCRKEGWDESGLDKMFRRNRMMGKTPYVEIEKLEDRYNNYLNSKK